MAPILNIIVVITAVAGGIYQIYFKPILVKFGYGRAIESIGNKDCMAVSELQACEKIVLHQPTGVLYLACSTPSSRTQWTPALARLNATGTTRDDYVATYDPTTSQITKLKIANFISTRGLSLHGMDVVASSSNASELYVYLVNHRAPLAGQPAYLVGADSSIEIFKTSVGSVTLDHIRTVEDSVIVTPNDLVGSSDGQSFYFTNDHGEKTGLMRGLDYFGRASSSVGYCHIRHGCKFAITKMHGNNGIARAPNDTFYVGDSIHGALSILERQSDNTLVVIDVVKIDRGIDNLAVDLDGVIWAAGLSNALIFAFKHLPKPTTSSPSSALRISINTGPTSFFGEKYKVDKAFEDDGNIASGITSVVHDPRGRLLFLHGEVI